MPPQDIEISELEREILIRVGSPNGPHVLSWEVLKKVGNSLEALFLALVKNSQMLNIKTVDADALKLQFSGFYEGSAVPAFKLASKSVLQGEGGGYPRYPHRPEHFSPVQYLDLVQAMDEH